MHADDSVTIQRASSSEDMRAITSLYPSKTEAEREEMVRGSLDTELRAQYQGKRSILLAKLGDMVVGTVQVVWENNAEDPGLQAPHSAVLHHLRTHPDYQGRGIGKQLVDAAEELAIDRGMARLTLGVEPANAHARRLYRKWGYAEFHQYHGEQGEPLLGMLKRLNDS